MCGCIAFPNHGVLINKEITALSIPVQALLFLIAICSYVYVDKLELIFKVNLYKGKNKISKKRSYRMHLKKRLKVFIGFEIFFVVFFITSLIITRLFGNEFSGVIFSSNKWFKSELIFLIYTIVGLLAMAVNLMHVNYLIQLSSKVFRKKPKPDPVNFDYYDFD
ncbi:MAG TPA: hypothetical protein VIL26_02820 [Clostridia bacterium]